MDHDSRPQPVADIVVINDDPAFLELARGLLEDEQYRVHVSTVGCGARDFVRARRPSLVILDIRLGDRSGWDVYQALALDPETKSIPVLVCSATGDLSEHEEDVRRLGGHVLRKPFGLDVLVARVRGLIG